MKSHLNQNHAEGMWGGEVWLVLWEAGNETGSPVAVSLLLLHIAGGIPDTGWVRKPGISRDQKLGRTLSACAPAPAACFKTFLERGCLRGIKASQIAKGLAWHVVKLICR